MIKTLLTTFCIIAFYVLYAQTYPSYDMGINNSATDTAGYLYDPGGANDNYNANTDVVFTVTSSNNKPINIQFIMFDMEPDILSAGACYDYVEIYDAATADPTALIGQWCGNNVPPDFTSTANTVTIHFLSDGGSETPGFKMFWTTGEMPEITPEYCEANGGGCTNNYQIYGVDFSDLSNAVAVCEPTGYSDYTHLLANVNAGENYQLTVTPEPFTFPGTKHYAWLDQNGDGGFGGSERIVLAGDETGIGANVTAVVLIEAGAKLGLTRLRIKSVEQPDPGVGFSDSDAPCGSIASGEVEDYTVLISDPAKPFPACPISSYPSDTATDICTNFLWTWSASNGTNVSYDIELWDNTDTKIIDELNWQTTSYSVISLNPNETYKGFLTAHNDAGKSYFCDSITFTTGVANPSVAIEQTNLSVCQGVPKSFTLDVTNGSTIADYNWSQLGATQLVDSTVVSPAIIDQSTPGQYPLTIVITDDRGCVSNQDSVSFTILERPVAGSLSISKADYCNNEPFLLTYPQDVNHIYEYSFDGGVNYSSLTPNYINATEYEVDLPFSSVLFRVIKTNGQCNDTTDVVNANKYEFVTQPLVDITSGNTINCEGDDVSIAVTNYSVNLMWNTSESTVSISPTTTGSYFVSYTDVNNCVVQSDSLYLLFNPAPQQPVITLVNGQFQIPNNNEHYQWFLDDVLIAEGIGLDTLTPAVNGDYHVVAISAEDCSSMPSDAYLLEDVSISEASPSDSQVTFYPNPTKHTLFIESTSISSISLMNMNGKLVFETGIQKGENKLKLDLPKGIYFIKIGSNLDVMTDKLVIL